MSSFRRFISRYPFQASLREEGEAAPAMGSVPSSEPQATTNDQHFDALKKQFGMSDEEFEAAIEGGAITLYQVPDFGWGFHPNPPVMATVEDRGDGTYNVTLLLSQMAPRSFTLPYRSGEQPHYYNGKIEDRLEVMTKKDLINAMTKPYDSMGVGGAPPMGGVGGGMGAPPGGMM